MVVLLKSNLYHLILKTGSIYKYQIETNPKVSTQAEFDQIIKYLQTFEPNLIPVINGFYITSNWARGNTHSVMLLKGQSVEVNIFPAQSKTQAELLQGVLNRIMINTKFVICTLLGSCYNPFQEKKTETGSEMPGFKLALYHQAQMGMFIIPEILAIENASDNLNANVLMNSQTGKFYNKSDVVKVDKERQLLTFRDKSEIPKKNLKPVQVKPVVGYDLAIALENYGKRIQVTSSDLIKYWGISISQKAQEMQVAFVDPGFISLKGVDKALNNMIFPVTRNAYNEYYKSNFDTAFEEFPTLEIYVCYSNQSAKSQAVIQAIENIKDRMNLEVAVYKAPDWKVANFIPRPNVLYLILADPALMSRKEIAQSLVQSQVVFHIMDEDSIQQNNKSLNETTVLQSLSVVCTKFRKAPWKLKNIPFCNQPLSVISLDVSPSKTGQLSVAMTFSINSLLSKFVSIIEETAEESLPETVNNMIEKCLLRFEEFHKRFPNRIIMFSSDNKYVSQTLSSQLKNQISHFYAQRSKGSMQFIHVTHKHCPSLQTYKMMTNLLNPQTVTQPGLLGCLVFGNKLCLQLQMNCPMREFSVFHQSNDPDFLKKMSELIAKLSFGSANNEFGGGLGFIGYSSKLNRYRNLDLGKWKGMLWEGHMLYL